VDLIDWGAAQRVGELIAGSPPYGGVRAASVEPLARDFARRVSAYSGLENPAELPPLETVDRSSWIAANLKSMRPMLATLAERLDQDGARVAGPLRGPLRSASGLLLGAQVGALTGMLSQRVLGQYDLSLLDAATPPRLLLLAPNLAQAARNLGVDRDELVLWVSIHEITHAVQFSGAPWLRDYLGGILKELIDGLQVTVTGRSAQRDRPAAGAPRPGRHSRDDRPRPSRGALTADAGGGPLAAGRANAGGHVLDRGARRAHDGRGRRRADPLAAAAAGRHEPPA
jgi:putative hydrolase